MDTPNPKCTRCKCYWKPDENDVKINGLVCKTCKKCRERKKKFDDENKCIHNKRKEICCKCDGSAFCIHNKHKVICRNCNGSALCIHNKQKATCRECNGNAFCIHNKRKSRCIECDGSAFCIHNRQKSNCKDCNFKLYLVGLQRKQINRCFKQSALEKTKHSIEYLGCNPEELITIFNKKMQYFNTYIATDTLMTWDNIHIDHIKPVSSFNLDDEEEFLDCCHYSNLQPLIVKDNLEKHNKWDENKQKYWEDNIRGKEYIEIYM
jgi:hypothetical protein